MHVDEDKKSQMDLTKTKAKQELLIVLHAAIYLFGTQRVSSQQRKL